MTYMKLLRVLRSRIGLALALLVETLVWGGPHHPHDAFPTSFAQAVDAQSRITEAYLDRDGVVGTAVGIDARGNHVVKVYLTVAGAASLPTRFMGVDVVPEITGRFWAGDAATARWGENDVGAGSILDAAALAPYRAGAAASEIDRKAVFPRPVPIGVSGGHADVTAGTIGARVTDGSRLFALSNNHVFAATNGGRSGDPVFQPGAKDGGGPDQTFARLHDFEPIRPCKLGSCPRNKIDAAVASTSPDQLDRATPEDGYGSPRSDHLDAKIGMGVQKYGRTTGHTKGRISGIHATIDVNYRTGIARFEDQIVIGGGTFSAPGDSGSLIVTDGVLLGDRRPVGLLFAGSRVSTLANPVGLVLDRFGVQVDGG